jgi:hypothetical protein
MPKTPVNLDQMVEVTLPYSEVCVHMKVAGKRMKVKLQTPWQAQLFTMEGEPFSFPIAPGEAGIYSDSTGFYLSE